MDLSRGFKRLTLVLSFLAGPLVLFYLLVTDSSFNSIPFDVLLIYEISGFFIVWIIYLVVLFVIKGFQGKPIAFMGNKLLIACWVVSLLSSYCMLEPAIKSNTHYKYKSSNDGFVIRRNIRENEHHDEYGSYFISGRVRYYYNGVGYFELDNRKHPYERIGFVIFFNSILLFYTFMRAKQKSKSGPEAKI
jgi:hypothetical protein